MKQAAYTNHYYQNLLEDLHRIEGQLKQIEQVIQEKQIQYYTGLDTETKNYQSSVGQKLQQSILIKKLHQLAPKDKIFSLSSVFSRVSFQLMNTQDKRLSIGQKPRSSKKKKNKKNRNKGKCIKKIKGKGKGK